MEKKLSYAYPSSSDAERLDYGESGCWIVEIISKTGVQMSESAFPSKGIALKAFDLVDIPISRDCQTRAKTFNRN